MNKVKVFKCQGCLGVFPATQAAVCNKCRKVVCGGCAAHENQNVVCVYCLGRKPRLSEEAVSRFVLGMIKRDATLVEKPPAKK